MKKVMRLLVLGLTVLALSGCPSGDSDNPSFIGGSSEESPGTASANSNESAPTVFRIGSFSGTTFTQGAIKANKSSLKAGENADLSVSIVDGTGNLVTAPVDIIFSSNCFASGLAQFDPATAENATGTVSVKYAPIGCDGSDQIRATTAVNGQTLTASVTLQTAPAKIGAITFSSATPSLIGLKGSGSIPEQSTVIFKVTNAAGGPVQNQVVDFELLPATGGVTLSNAQGTTAADGTVQTIVNAGEVATTVRVKATATQDGSTTSANSSGLAVSTGIPDQDSFSLSVETLNIEGGEIDGTTTEVTIRAADRYNNPVADNTSINFIAEGGSIGSNCLTVNGACSVTFTSQEPRPSDHRVTILATAVGEETFVDSSPSNGRFDDAETFTDIDEAFLDEDEDGIRDGNEKFVDYNTNNTYDLKDSLFNGLLCNGPRCGAGAAKTLTVSDQAVIVLSDSTHTITATPSIVNLDSGATTTTATVSVSVFGSKTQVPPAGTNIIIATTHGTLISDNLLTVDNTSALGPYTFSVTISPEATKGSGILSISVETPRNVVRKAAFNVIQNNDSPP